MGERRRRESGAARPDGTSFDFQDLPAVLSSKSCLSVLALSSASSRAGPGADPSRTGKRLGRELSDYFSACRGSYQVTYRLLDEGAVGRVVRIEHRADVYWRRVEAVRLEEGNVLL